MARCSSLCKGGAPLVLLLLLLCPVLVHPQSVTVNGRIQNIVVLVMENRSFDHMLGFLKRLNPEIDGLNGNEFNYVTSTAAAARQVFVSDIAQFVDPDPGHAYQDIAEQVFGPGARFANPAPMSGFAAQADSVKAGMSKNVMSAFRPEDIPVHTNLAMNYAVFDRWFSSVPSSTQPNRFFVHSATSHGLMSNLESQLTAGLPQRTIMEDVDDAGLTFGIYYQNVPTTLFFSNMRKVRYTNNFKDYGLHFQTDASMGRLPNYVVVEQRYFDIASGPANDDHPSHDIAQGQKLIKEVYETLRAGPQWNNMLLLVTYDEHGGFYDHVPTPLTGVPNPDGIKGPAPYNFNFDRLGVRVPTIAISPWINAGIVVHEPNGPMAPYSQFEHSSIPATVRKLFNLPSGPLTAREQWAGTFDGLVMQRASPRTDTPVTLGQPPASLRHKPTNEQAKITEFQSELVVLAAALNGGEKMTTAGETMTVGEANYFVERAVARFLTTGRAQLRAGGDPDALVKMEKGSVFDYKP